MGGEIVEATEPRAVANAAMADTSAGYSAFVVLFLMVVLSLNYADRQVLAVLLEQIKGDLRLTDSQLGLVSGLAFTIFYAGFGLPLARIVDRSSRVMLMTWSIVVWSLATAASGLAQTFTQLFLSRVFTGAGEASCIPGGHSLIAAYVPREKRSMALGVFHAGGALGNIGGMMAAGLLAGSLGWRAAFLIVGLPGVVLALLFRLTVKEPPRPVTTTPPAGFMATYGVLLRRPTYVNVSLAFALLNFSVFALNAWLPAFYQRLHGMSVAQVGVWVGLAGGAGSAMGVAMGGTLAMPLIRRDPRWTLWYPALCMAIATPIYMLALGVASTTLSLGLLFLAGLVVQMGSATALATVHAVSAPAERGQAIALLVMASAILGVGFGPVAVGLLSDAFHAKASSGGLRTALIVAMAGFGWAVLHCLLASRTLAKDTVD